MSFLLSFPGWISEIAGHYLAHGYRPGNDLRSGKDIANQAVAHRLRLCRPSTLILQQILRKGGSLLHKQHAYGGEQEEQRCCPEDELIAKQ